MLRRRQLIPLGYMVREGKAKETALKRAIKGMLSPVVQRGSIEHLQRHGESQQYGMLGEVEARALRMDLGQSGSRKARVRDTRYEATIMIQVGDANTL